MISLMAIGVEEYKNCCLLCDIPCAYSDAKMVYNQFDKILGNDMKKYSSTSLKNITALECRNLFSTLQLSIENEDIFIFYFSGHGILSSNGKLKLAFADYNEDTNKGALTVSEIVLILSSYGCKIALILDCCYSGAGISESNIDDVKLENNISILASNGPISQAQFEKNGSLFTNYLLESMEYIYYNQQDISLDNICDAINKKSDKKCKIVTGGGCSDLVIRGGIEHSCFPSDFCDKFIEKIHSSNYEMREALWYEVGDFPEPTKVEMVSKYITAHNGVVAEMSWRVRRSIGSICRDNITKAGKELVNDFLSSKIWMDRCIGYICAHQNNDIEVTKQMINELENGNNIPMDLIWLIVLYLSERNLEDSTIIMKTNLLQTTWGSIEIWKRYFHDISIEDKLKLFKSEMDDKNYAELCLDLYFRENYRKIDFTKYSSLVKKYEEKFKSLYARRKRGPIKETYISKWIFSTLYGNWRDQINLNEILRSQLEHELTENEIPEYLSSLQYIPSIEIKMAILDFFVSNRMESKYSSYKNNLKWALIDKHPWVIRTALPLFLDKLTILFGNKDIAISIRLYPGVYDLIIELKKQGVSEIQYNNKDMTSIECEQLLWATEKE